MHASCVIFSLALTHLFEHTTPGGHKCFHRALPVAVMDFLLSFSFFSQVVATKRKGSLTRTSLSFHQEKNPAPSAAAL